MKKPVPGFHLGYVDVICETHLAILVETEDSLEQFWIPKSQIHKTSEVDGVADGSGYLVVSKWLADQNGWEDDED